MNNNSFRDEIKRLYTTGGMHIRLIMINAVVFLTLEIAGVFARLISKNGEFYFRSFTNKALALQTDVLDFATHPWGIFTYMFTHGGFFHFLMNMIFLFFAGQMFLQFFSAKRLLHTYLLGGLAGGLLEIVAPLIFPELTSGIAVVGASGSIMAIFIALGFYRPQLQVNLFGILPVRLIILAILFMVSDLLRLGIQDGTAHFAHLGGGILGVFSVRNPFSRTNIVERSIRIGDKIGAFFSGLIPRKNMRVVSRNEHVKRQSDEDYNADKNRKQERIDQILDKISRSGYDSLTKEEKDLLFKQSQR